MSQSSTAQTIAVVAFSSLLMSTAAWAATPTATDPSQDSAATPTQAEEPRLPTADDTHRTGPEQSDAGSGAVPAEPQTLSPEAKREELGGSSAERMEQGRQENGQKQE
ncbi:hypothetical protein FOZ76_06105 [Verticiella sediminum]|uniref:Uncharacterized protein n=1 Tax=Verticiella sediminum TaxID=1247510 RepID=A0A556AWJ8_9BURK|nr:hypothetical protein [Verticiella sediminum]TSH97300.1 hypothetical protein FOZ76_06105 [Verticiella sediminum]